MCEQQKMVTKVNISVKKRGMEVNVSKTKVMVFERGVADIIDFIIHTSTKNSEYQNGLLQFLFRPSEELGMTDAAIEPRAPSSPVRKFVPLKYDRTARD
ncbi:hypothetical protein EVAR_80075_1 [Eumeta japonica]|uniref:Uncharacterized protein n=1 Tax=Eumeta variegata TaxID=151549 RepID=A0A4C1UE17_EUMVA|nr:hypothetical protein EVAR_80075_1 [Eumeta japonica]